MRYWIFILFFTVSTPSVADQIAAAEAFRNGRFLEAIQLGQEAATPTGLMTACRAGMVYGGYTQTHDSAVKALHQSIQDCHKVVLDDTANSETRMNALITLAIGVGFEGKRWKKPAYAKLSKTILEKVQNDFQNQPAAHAAIGGWHSEVSAAGFLARVYLGASRSKAKKRFTEALAMGEKGLPFRLEYVKLLARGNKSEREKATQLAFTHTRDIPREALDRLMRDKLMLIGTALQSDEKHTIKKAIAEATAFNGIEEWRSVPLLDLDFIKHSLGF